MEISTFQTTVKEKIKKKEIKGQKAKLALEINYV